MCNVDASHAWPFLHTTESTEWNRKPQRGSHIILQLLHTTSTTLHSFLSVWGLDPGSHICTANAIPVNYFQFIQHFLIIPRYVVAETYNLAIWVIRITVYFSFFTFIYFVCVWTHMKVTEQFGTSSFHHVGSPGTEPWLSSSAAITLSSTEPYLTPLPNILERKKHAHLSAVESGSYY